VNGKGGKMATAPARSRKKILSWVDTPDEVYFVADASMRYVVTLCQPVCSSYITTTEHASFHGHRTVSATEPFLLPDLKSGTICHRNCDTWTSALDNSETC